MANDGDTPPLSATATRDYADVSSTIASNTRRTSTTSSVGMANQGNQGGASTSLHNSLASLQSPDPVNQSQQRPRPRPLDYGSMQGSSQRAAPRSPHPSSHTPKPQRPGTISRKASAAPHRGDIFSVDDDVNEVTEDTRAAKALSKQDVQRERQLRRRESTLRRRPTVQAPPNLPRVESSEGEERAQTTGNDAPRSMDPAEAREPSSEDTLQGEEEAGEEEETPSPDEDDDELSDAESFTLKDRQEAINETHPFGIRIWKPALYKKDRSVQRNAEGDIHSAPGGNVSPWLWLFNFLWTIIFGWWMALIAAFGGVICTCLGMLQEEGSEGCQEYGRVLINLAHYLFYPFGKYVRLERDEAYLHEDEGEGRAIDEYERWQAGDIEEGRLFFGPTDINRSLIGRRRDEVEGLDDNETDSLLAGPGRQNSVARRARDKTKKRLFGRGKWNVGRVIFFLSFYLLITPCLLVVSAICWFLVFSIPMGKVTLLLFYHLRRHPLAMKFHTDSHYARVPSQPRHSVDSVVLLCTYRAVGLKYWKYTIDGTNIFLINLLGLVVFAIFDYFVLYETLHIESWITAPGLVFVLALASIIPLAYFIGQAVASISAQSSMGVGATINAFFSTVVEVFLYCVALSEGKAQLVEGSIIGSIFAGILFLPGLSMCFGAIKRKTQRFNVKSAGVTSTMLLFAVIGGFAPTLFYQIYGSHVLNCRECITINGQVKERDCRRCYFDQVPEVNDRFFREAVRPFIWFAAVCLFLSYVVGLLFTLRTHAATIWNLEPDEKKEGKIEHSHQQVPGTGGLVSMDGSASMSRPSIGGRNDTVGTVRREDIRDSQMYKRILNHSLKQAGVLQTSTPAPKSGEDGAAPKSAAEGQTPHIVPPKNTGDSVTSPRSVRLQGLSAEDNRALVQQVAEIAATAATVAARDATKAPRRASIMATSTGTGSAKRSPSTQRHHDQDLPPDGPLPSSAAAPQQQHHEEPGGHDAPNWSRTKSAVILLTATVAYAVIAEILVDTVDVVLSNIDIPEKFLGITLFALVPNTTEFLNAISFAMNGNVALSMEIGSSYALQVMLLQIPALVLFSALYIHQLDRGDYIDHTFSLIFPQWDMVTVILAVFLMGWVVGEGKSNYFKGSILIFTYLVVVVGFWFTGYNNMETMGIDRFDSLALASSAPASFKTIGQGRSGRAY